MAFLILFIHSGTLKAEVSTAIKEDSVKIDFGSCVPDRKRIDVTMGSTTYQIIGLGKNGCVMKYGEEVENPGWDGSLTKACVIPVSEGIRTFKKTDTGVDFTPIAQYCS